MEKVVMIDWDGVVVGNDYKPTEEIDPYLIRSWWLKLIMAPNSDTSVPRLRSFFESVFR